MSKLVITDPQNSITSHHNSETASDSGTQHIAKASKPGGPSQSHNHRGPYLTHFRIRGDLPHRNSHKKCPKRATCSSDSGDMQADRPMRCDAKKRKTTFASVADISQFLSRSWQSVSLTHRRAPPSCKLGKLRFLQTLHVLHILPPR